MMISIFDPLHDSCVDWITSYQSINFSRHTKPSLEHSYSSTFVTTTITYTNNGHSLVNARSHAAAAAHEDRGKRRGADADQP